MNFLRNKPTSSLIFLFLAVFLIRSNVVSASEAQFAKCNALKGELQQIQAAFNSNTKTYRQMKVRVQAVANECNSLKEKIRSSFGKVERPQFKGHQQFTKEEYGRCYAKLDGIEKEMTSYLQKTQYYFEFSKLKSNEFQACLNDYNYASKNKAWYERIDAFLRVVAEESEEAVNNIQKISSLKSAFR